MELLRVLLHLLRCMLFDCYSSLLQSFVPIKSDTNVHSRNHLLDNAVGFQAAAILLLPLDHYIVLHGLVPKVFTKRQKSNAGDTFGGVQRYTKDQQRHASAYLMPM